MKSGQNGDQPGAIVSTDVGVLGELAHFEATIHGELRRASLPVDGLFVSEHERYAMLSNVGTVLSELDEEVRGRSYYISKMIAAAAVGLFDAALNYLWDELVNELRRRVAGFDLGYFFDIAAGSSDLRKHLKDEDDLSRIDDVSLLRAAHEIGLLSDVGYKRLDHVRYMRNHASAAHPNQVDLSGLDLANWLQICIREVITTPPDTVTASIGRLLSNVKKYELDEEAVRNAAAFFDQLRSGRADTLANGFFGLYTDPARTPEVADNVRKLWPEIWEYVSEETRASYGLRLARANANAERDFSTAARELIDLVDGAAYLTPEARALELSEALEDLKAAHHGMNNFFTEEAPAKRIAALVGKKGRVPDSLRSSYVKTLVEAYLGNPYGVSWAAAPTYDALVKRFDGRSAALALRLFNDPVFASILSRSVAQRRWGQLLDALEPKLTGKADRQLMAAVKSFGGTPDQLHKDARIQKLLT